MDEQTLSFFTVKITNREYYPDRQTYTTDRCKGELSC